MAIHDVECCEECAVHDEVVQSVRGMLPDDDDLYDLAELFKVFGDSTRIRILFVLFESEMCVCDIAQLLNMTQSAISHQLRILKQNKLVKSRREGKSIFYSLAACQEPPGRKVGVLFAGRRPCLPDYQPGL